MRVLKSLQLIAFLVTVLFARSVLAAETETMDVTLGKNGSVVKGKIIERIEGKKVTIVTNNGQRIDIPFSKISEITTTDTDYEKRHIEILDSLNASRGPELKIVGRVMHIDLNIGGDDTSNSVSLTGVTGMMTNTGFSIGFGAGWDQHGDKRFLPLFGEIGYYFTGRKWTPYVSLQGGYSLGWFKSMRKSDYGGFRWGIGTGLQRAMTETLSLTMQVSYNQQAAGNYSAIQVPYFKWISGSLGIAF